MPEINTVSPSKQIRNLLIVIGSAICAALLLAGLLLAYYNPNGAYLAKNVMLAPATILKDSAIASPEIKFSYYDVTHRGWKSIHVSLDHYEKLYQLLSMDESLVGVTDEIKEFFLSAPVASLVVNVSASATEPDRVSLHSTVDFSSAQDFYRIQLHDPANPEGWAYFSHPQIKQTLLQLLLSHDQ